MEPAFILRKTGQAMSHTILIKVIKGRCADTEMSFSDLFTIGRSKAADFVVNEPMVSRQHARVEFVGDGWWVEDLKSGNGLFLNGARIDRVRIAEEAVLELGLGGPQVLLTVLRPVETVAEPDADDPMLETVYLGPQPTTTAQSLGTETQIIRHYLEKPEENAGEQTMMFRRAFSRAHQTRTRKYKYLIGLTVMLLVVAGSVILYQNNKLDKMRATAQNIFYTMKGQEIQIARLEDLVMLKADPQQVAELQAKREKFRGLEKDYDGFVKELGIYGKLSDEDKVIMKMARVFGECEIAMPPGFADEVKRYIGIWKSSDRLKTALVKAQQKGYTPIITKILQDNNLPPQYFFLALQESNFDEKAVGPETRYGCAKGMWQFISQTADRYGLHIGPLFDQRVYDPQDERHNFVKSTLAAMKYIKELSSTNAQASGLLVLASYNWGEGNVRDVINRMPENPRERNFWRLLSMKTIPKETYDYVFMIFSAAVICDNPKLFGFDGACPACGKPVQTAPANMPQVAPDGKPV
jgi:membrane-bound lytic murein transglycosylase D